MRVVVRPVELHGHSGLEGDLVVLVEAYRGKEVMTVHFSVELFNQMGALGAIGFMLSEGRCLAS